MKKILRVSSICLGIFLISVASSNAANIRPYAGVNYFFANYEDDYDIEADSGVAGIKLGVDINDYIGIEMRVGVGVDDDTIDVLGVDVKVEVDHAYGLYVRPKFRQEQVQVYGLLGFTEIEYEVSVFGLSIEDDETDFSFGAGLEYFFNDNVSVSVEYMQLLDKDDYEVESYNIGFTYYY